jgi:hypothetical protein
MTMDARAHGQPVRALAAALIITAVPAWADPVITEVAWGGDPATDSGTDEWIEIHNPADQPVDLDGFIVLGAGAGAAAVALPALSLAEGDFFIIQNTAGVPSADATRSLTTSSLSLVDGGEALCLCPAGAAACDAGVCDVVGAGGAWFAGSNAGGARTSMERKAPGLDGTAPASWQDGTPASPSAHSPAVGEGEGEGEGEPPSPNHPPVVSMSAPAGSQTGAIVEVAYAASDPDIGDDVSVDLFWSLEAAGNVGVRFAQGLPGGDQTASFDTAAVAPGTVHVFAHARDTRGASAFAYAPGTVVVAGGPQAASFELVTPDGVNDIEDGVVLVTWTATLPVGAEGTVSLFLDEDDGGEGGAPLIGGLSAASGGPRAFLVELSALAPGERFVYGVLDHQGGRVVSYAPASILVPATGCACSESGGDSRGTRARPSLLAVAGLAILLAGGRRRQG